MRRRATSACSPRPPPATPTNGPAFLARRARRPAAIRSSCCRASARRSSRRSASSPGFHAPDGVVGDLGGGSLELVDVRGDDGRAGHDAAARRPRAAGPRRRLAQEGRARSCASALAKAAPQLATPARAARFYAVGGTWRALARLHMARAATRCTSCTATASSSTDELTSCSSSSGSTPSTLKDVESGLRGAPAAPRLRRGRARGDHPRSAGPRDIVDLGARRARGPALRAARPRDAAPHDPLLAAARELNALRSRSPRHGEELVRLDRRASCARLGLRRDAPTSAACATPPACSPISAGARIPIIAASRAST